MNTKTKYALISNQGGTLARLLIVGAFLLAFGQVVQAREAEPPVPARSPAAGLPESLQLLDPTIAV